MQLSACAFIRILNSKAVLLLMALALLQLLWLIRFDSAFCILCKLLLTSILLFCLFTVFFLGLIVLVSRLESAHLLLVALISCLLKCLICAYFFDFYYCVLWDRTAMWLVNRLWLVILDRTGIDSLDLSQYHCSVIQLATQIAEIKLFGVDRKRRLKISIIASCYRNLSQSLRHCKQFLIIFLVHID